MLVKAKKSVKTWVFVYLAMIAAVFTHRGDAMSLPEVGNLSPVIISSDAPKLRIDSLVQRSDI